MSDSGLHHDAPPRARRRSKRDVAERIALVLALAAVGGLLWFRFHPDPYGAGSSHRYTVEKTSPCMTPDWVELDGRAWRAAGPGSKSNWSDWQFPLPGTFHIEGGGTADFVPDEGGSIPFEGGGRFLEATCPLQ